MRSEFAALVVLFIAMGCATPQSPDSAPSRDSSEFSYFNERFGVRLDVPPEWELYTQADEAPWELAGSFAKMEARGAALLLTAHQVGSAAFIRLLAEPSPLSAEDYFAKILKFNAPRVDVLKAEWSDERNSGLWRHRVKKGIFVVVIDEWVTLYGGQGIRLVSGTIESLVAEYESEFSAIADSVEFERDGRWVALWNGLESSLSSEKLSHIELYSAPPDAPVAACPDGKRQLLWRVEGESASVYLFGSIHLGKPNFYPLPDVIEQAFADSQHLVVEVDVDDEEAQMKMVAAINDALLPEDQTLRDVLDPAVFDRLSIKMSELGLPLEPFLKLEPWAVAVMIMALELQAAGYLPEHGVEAYFYGLQTHQDVIELESVDFQLALFDEMDGEVFLSYMLSPLDSDNEQFERLIHAWRCGDQQVLFDIAVGQYSGDLPGFEDFLRLFITERNMEMTHRLEGMLREGQGQYFVVVGAAHLVGEDGIVDLLRRSGWQVDSI